jgi:hypothetical protein
MAEGQEMTRTEVIRWETTETIGRELFAVAVAAVLEAAPTPVDMTVEASWVGWDELEQTLAGAGWLLERERTAVLRRSVPGRLLGRIATAAPTRAWFDARLAEAWNDEESPLRFAAVVSTPDGQLASIATDGEAEFAELRAPAAISASVITAVQAAAAARGVDVRTT